MNNSTSTQSNNNNNNNNILNMSNINPNNDAILSIHTQNFVSYTSLVQGLVSPVALCDPGSGSSLFLIDQVGVIYIWDRFQQPTTTTTATGTATDTTTIPNTSILSFSSSLSSSNSSTSSSLFSNNNSTTNINTNSGLSSSSSSSSFRILLDRRSYYANNLNPSYDERGLLNLVAHPLYGQNKLLYLFYTTINSTTLGMDHDVMVEELQYVKSIDPITSKIVESLVFKKRLLQIPHPQSNHNGGGMCFITVGPASLSSKSMQNFLLVGLGDGGGSGDSGVGHTLNIGNAQDDTSRLGKVWMIGVDETIPTFRMVIKGCRNPWKITYETLDNSIWIGNAGQDKWESIFRIPLSNLFIFIGNNNNNNNNNNITNSPSIVTVNPTSSQIITTTTTNTNQNNIMNNIISNPLNLGWKAYEGFPHVYDSQLATSLQYAVVFPFLNYSHDQMGNNSIASIGGTMIKPLFYCLGDFSGNPQYDPVFYTNIITTQPPILNLQPRTANLPMHLLSFGKDRLNQIYALMRNNSGPSQNTGQVFQLSFQL